MDRADLEARANVHALTISGVVNRAEDRPLPSGAASLVLLSPKEPEFWPLLTDSPEGQDSEGDAVDRWSSRVVSQLAKDWGGAALFPFGPPPYHPFYTWALWSGAIHVSPVSLLVSKSHGLFISFRGAIALPFEIEAEAVPSPCDTCADKPCTAACPVAALSTSGYDVSRCHDYLDTAGGTACLSGGCLARRACPFGANRPPEQSAYHMRHFHR